jgi:LysR family transcriptional regulator, glycine cleavage system transcriptional activator
MPNLPHVTWLASFEAAARHASFSAAADELGLTPAAVSQQIRLLEQHLGVALFKRLPRGVMLTDIGQAFAQPIRRSFSEMKTATHSLFETSQKRVVRVRASISYAGLVIAPRIAEFSKLHPDISIILSTFVWSDRFDDDQSDLDIRYGFGNWTDGQVQHMGHANAIPVCHPSYSASFAAPLSLHDLARAKIVRILGSETDWARISALYDLNLEIAPEWFTADSSFTALQTVISGTGVVMVLESFARYYIDLGLLVAPLPYQLPIAASHFLVQRELASVREEVQLVRKWILGFAS